MMPFSNIRSRVLRAGALFMAHASLAIGVNPTGTAPTYDWDELNRLYAVNPGTSDSTAYQYDDFGVIEGYDRAGSRR